MRGKPCNREPPGIADHSVGRFGIGGNAPGSTGGFETTRPKHLAHDGIHGARTVGWKVELDGAG